MAARGPRPLPQPRAVDLAFAAVLVGVAGVVGVVVGVGVAVGVLLEEIEDQLDLAGDEIMARQQSLVDEVRHAAAVGRETRLDVGHLVRGEHPSLGVGEGVDRDLLPEGVPHGKDDGARVGSPIRDAGTGIGGDHPNRSRARVDQLQLLRRRQAPIEQPCLIRRPCEVGDRKARRRVGDQQGPGIGGEVDGKETRLTAALADDRELRAVGRGYGHGGRVAAGQELDPAVGEVVGRDRIAVGKGDAVALREPPRLAGDAAEIGLAAAGELGEPQRVVGARDDHPAPVGREAGDPGSKRDPVLLRAPLDRGGTDRGAVAV